ncbi:hypothetical protein D9M73_254610 [compost metagenome]
MQGDAGAAPFDAVGDADPPAMGTDHALTDRQPQPGALPAPVATGGGVEHVENLRPLVLRNPRAFVAHREKQLGVVRPGTQLQAPMGGGKPRGVFQHVDQRLFDQRRMHEQQR